MESSQGQALNGTDSLRSYHLVVETEVTNNEKKQIHMYQAPWRFYAMGFSRRVEHQFRLAIGSFIEDTKNKVRPSACHAIRSG